MDSIDLIENKDKWWHIFRESKFYISVILVLASICFGVIPHILVLIFKERLQGHLVIPNIVKMFYKVAMLVDASVYILIHPAVRRMLLKKLGFSREHPQRHRNPTMIRLETFDRMTTVMSPETAGTALSMAGPTTSMSMIESWGKRKASLPSQTRKVPILSEMLEEDDMVETTTGK